MGVAGAQRMPSLRIGKEVLMSTAGIVVVTVVIVLALLVIFGALQIGIN
jgi:hypothetical protein